MLQISVPATSANLGPGFDCVGLALDLNNEFYFFESEVAPPPKTTLLRSGSLVHQGLDLVQHRYGKKIPALKIAVKTKIPRARGLGSSATLTVAGVAAASIWGELNLSTSEIINLASEIEGHLDNVAPAVIGGLVPAVATPQGIKYLKIIPPKPLKIIVGVPDFRLSTAAARNVLPKQVAYTDAIFNTGRFGLLMTALITGEYQMLPIAMQDRLHQPYRAPLIPGWEEVITEINASGALGCCLSGAGPSILVFCEQNTDQISFILENTWRQQGVKAQTYLLTISLEGMKYCWKD
ncbi:MAG TPA: homoserine kinase [Clostridia bacterium]|nr:homoserine kinase [Clostridia bacterium]